MRLGGTVAGQYGSIREWEDLLVRSRFKAITAPFNCDTPREETDEYCEVARKHDVVIAEVGVWRNLFDPNPEEAAKNLDFAKRQLALADERHIACCVNVAGTAGLAGWDAADPSNFSDEMYEKLISCIRDIVDSVRPAYACYTLEPMPWMIPDSPQVYLQLIKDVDREHFAAHMDFVNMINCPRRYLAPERFVEECFSTLAPYIKSTHLKDSRMDPRRLTTFLSECSPGEGSLDFGRILAIIDKYMPADAPVLLEHMSTFEEYARAYDYVVNQ